MTQRAKFLSKLLSGYHDSEINFKELIHQLQDFGFHLRIRGDHHIFSRFDISEIINLQPIGKYAKVYQVKQVRKVIQKYKLGGSNGFEV